MRVLGGLLLIVVLMGLGGCHAPPTSPRALPSTSSILSSEDEALAASTSALEAFLATSTLILAEGGAGASRLNAVASQELAESEAAGFKTFADNEWRSIGAPTVISLRLQSWSRVPDPLGIISIVYACIDYASVNVVNEHGESVVHDERAPLQAVEVAFAIQRTEPIQFIVASKSSLSKAGVCD